MKINRLFAASLFLAAVTSLPVYAQQNARSAAPAGGAAGVAAAIPDSKIGFINTEAFADEKQGIVRYVTAMKSLEREFQPRQNELITLQTQLKGIADDITKLNNNQSVVDPKTIQQKQEQGVALQNQLEFKKKEAEAAYQKRMQEVVAPISDDIGKALDAFSRQRGINLMLDISKFAPAVLSVNPAMDMTAAFIAEYNSRAATTAAPRPRR
ncbi:MAG: OmpH family outer membrane protein [Pyrinomonadaceae bacterium]